MQIHTVKKGETYEDIARQYGVSEEKIKRDNSVISATPLPGEELLVIIPTRTYTPRKSDTLDTLSLRFGTKATELRSLNPEISDTEQLAAIPIVLKCGDRPYGMSASNGYYYKGCDQKKLRAALPYLTYITFAAAKMDESGISYLFNPRTEVSLALKHNIIPILKVFDEYNGGLFSDEKNKRGALDSLILFAKAEGFKGIALSLISYNDKEEEVCEFLVELRGKMIGCDLILISELDECSPKSFAEYSDGNIFSYMRADNALEESYSETDEKIYTGFACESESTKTFIELPVFAQKNSCFLTVEEAIAEAHKYGCEINNDASSLYNSYKHTDNKQCFFPSLKNIKATLDIIHEYGFMGISFDITRTPLSYLMMYNFLFKTALSGAMLAEEYNREL